jgi:hypothetical protein
MAGTSGRGRGRAFLELFALSGFAVVQPLLDHLGRNATELVTGGFSGLEIVLLVVGLLVVPPLIAWAAELAVGRLAPGVVPYVHAAFAALAALVFTVTLLKPRTGLGPWVLVGLGVLAGLALGLVVLRSTMVRQWLRYLVIAPIALAVVFVVGSPASAVIGGRDPATAAVTARHPHRVVMIVLDEFPLESLLDGNGRIDRTLYPNFAALADGSHWYRNSTTVAPFTEAAVPALLTGDEPPSQDALPSFTTYPHNLFTLLGRSYDLNVHETLTKLCPDSLCGSDGSGGLADLGRIAADDWWDLASPDRLEASQLQTATWPAPQFAGEPFVRSLQPARGPTLDFLHVALPHQEWRFLPTGQDNHASLSPGIHLPPNSFSKPRWTNRWSARSGRQAHLLQVQATDRLLGEIVARLRAIGAYDDSMLVVTADHGVAFQARQPLRGVSATNFPQVLWTPTFVKYPDEQQGVTDDRPARSVDVLPTIAATLGIDAPWSFDGRSLTAAPRRTTAVRTLDWTWSTIHPAHGKFLTVDGTRGLAAALGGRATDAIGDPALRLYRIGPYGAMVGTTAPPLTGPTTGQATIDPAVLGPIRPDAHDAPWTRASGTVTGVAPGTWLAVSVNGTVAGLTRAYRADTGAVLFWSELAPQMFRAGTNAVGLWQVSGPADGGQLRRIALGPGASG